MVSTRILVYSLLVFSAVTIPAVADAHTEQSAEVAAVHFPIGCNATASEIVEQAVAQLHHMMYQNARTLFNEASVADPECAIALWGVAMTYIHPLWPDRPSPEILSIGAELSARAVAIGGHDAREDAYIATVSAYFENAETRTEAERLLRFAEAWKAVYEDYPEDQEAKAFIALATLATVDRNDMTYAQQRKAGAIVEELLDIDPDHPGAHHYIIHAYDFPGLAQQALPVARDYGVIAPEVPHALHMMTHTFTRLGLWDECIEWNLRSADAAWKLSEDNGAISVHYQHALDYLAYAYLQKGDDDKALDVVRTMASLTPPFGTVNRDAQAYAFAAVPARYALERKDWAAAATLEPRVPAKFPWEPRHDRYVANTHFSRGLGLAHEERFVEAEFEVTALENIRKQSEAASPYWSTQAEIQRLSVQAWILFLSGNAEDGITRMREASTLEASTGKNPVTPGEVLPAAELLGDMLSELGLYEEAVTAYDIALTRSPRRLNSLYGAGRAREMMRDVEAARVYFAEIAAMVSEESSRASVEHARRF